MTWDTIDSPNPEWDAMISDYTDVLDNDIAPSESAWDFAERHGIDQQYMFDALEYWEIYRD